MLRRRSDRQGSLLPFPAAIDDDLLAVPTAGSTFPSPVSEGSSDGDEALMIGSRILPWDDREV